MSLPVYTGAMHIREVMKPHMPAAKTMPDFFSKFFLIFTIFANYVDVLDVTDRTYFWMLSCQMWFMQKSIVTIRHHHYGRDPWSVAGWKKGKAENGNARTVGG